jgi:uncharacterized protein (DUF2235 family)
LARIWGSKTRQTSGIPAYALHGARATLAHGPLFGLIHIFTPLICGPNAALFRALRSKILKRIAIFCDGTWNRADAVEATNVVRLSQALSLSSEAQGDESIFQQMFYVQGVGSGRGAGKLSRLVDRLGGGAFGWGLTQNIEEAYRALAFSYQPGDEIYIFGFSRGAYTARSLAGLIRSAGIPPRAGIFHIADAIARYRSGDKGTHPNDPLSFAFRYKINPALVTSTEEADWRKVEGLETGHLLKIAYLGVWDTVGALGLPGHYGQIAKAFNSKYSFHDAALSRSVASARHAVSIDERRGTFPPTLWDNLAKLNDGEISDTRPYQQLWFAGDHGSVGGGGDIRGLSDDALAWIAKGARAAGLVFDPGTIAAFEAGSDPFAPLSNKSKTKGGFFARLTKLRTKDRDGPDDPRDVSPAAVKRWRNQIGYRPKTLKKVSEML